MRVLSRLFWAFIFFTLFAFALNNQQTAVVHFFFGLQWFGPMVFVVLVAFGAGCAAGVLAMAPHWWHQRREVRRLAPAATEGSLPSPAPGPAGRTADVAAEHPPREGL